MFLEISHRGETLLLRRLAPTESLDPARHVYVWCAAHDLQRAMPSGHIPSGCADYRCEVRETKGTSVVVSDALDFFLDSEEVTP